MKQLYEEILRDTDTGMSGGKYIQSHTCLAVLFYLLLRKSGLVLNICTLTLKINNNKTAKISVSRKHYFLNLMMEKMISKYISS